MRFFFFLLAGMLFFCQSARGEETFSYTNSMEIMGMSTFQSGDIQQTNGRLRFNHIGQETVLNVKGSFQEISNDGNKSQAADARGELRYPRETVYGYLLGGGNWRSNRRDFYYYFLGPGVEVVEGLTVEVGLGEVFSVPGAGQLSAGSALDFRYTFTAQWGFEEKMEGMVLLKGANHDFFESDSALSYKINDHTAFKMSLIYTSIDAAWHRVQTLIGLDYKF